ncbi:unnamed protein product [Plutella xylostella]|uniref:(diamondback moth) hypothetical protein n=1 Tax=Plutella xylostella TaxID=51655 RepID=A0A8S4D3I1_PLUXY|nr:unnamed protein product [Plutella xylostella]
MKFIYSVVLFTILLQVTFALEYKDYWDEDWDKKDDSVESNEGYSDEPKPPVYDVKQAPVLFRRFVEDYDKHYKNEEDYRKHFKNFVNNLEDINRLNAEGGTATFDINMFADLSDDELRELRGRELN